MRADVKQRWVEALRSGEYRQISGELVGDDGCSFCAVGVLAELYARAQHERPLAELSFFNVLRDGVMPWAQLSLDDVSPSGWWNEVICANDRGESFPRIADMIERLVP